MMYTLPDMCCAEDNLKTIDMDELALCSEDCAPKSQYPCDETVLDICCLLMQERGWDAPTDAFLLLNCTPHRELKYCKVPEGRQFSLHKGETLV